MKVAIPVDENKLDTTVCISFGRTPYFLIYDIDTDNFEVIENSAADARSGAGPKAAQLVVDQNVKALLVPRCGENAAAVIESAEIAVYKTESTSVAETIKAFKNNSLKPLNEIHSGLHNHG